MPFITATGSPYSSLKVRPLANSQLKPEELIKVPKGQKLGVTFPYSDSDKPFQAVRLVAPASDLKLNGGDILYAFPREWLHNDQPWEIIKPRKGSAVGSILDNIFTLGKYTRYDPKQMGVDDYHIRVIDSEADSVSHMICYDSKGSAIWKKDCLAKGQTSDWGLFSGDTPQGLYRLGECWIADFGDSSTCKPYGIYCFDMISVIDGEDATGRAGICMHGGGSALGYPGCNHPFQKLLPTFGCIRVHNDVLKNVIHPMWEATQRSGKTIWVSVYQL
jgi:hypothetical protein